MKHTEKFSRGFFSISNKKLEQLLSSFFLCEKNLRGYHEGVLGYKFSLWQAIKENEISEKQLKIANKMTLWQLF